MRANGEVKFLRISAKLQRRIAMGCGAVVGCWALVTGAMALNQVSVSFERMALSKKEARVQSAEERVAQYRESIDDVTEDLEKRQNMLEELYLDHFSKEEAARLSKQKIDDEKEIAKANKIGQAIPEAAPLAKIEARQIGFANKLTRLAEIRARRAEAAIRKFGLNPDIFVKSVKQAQGGPFIPFFGRDDNDLGDPRFARLAKALERMEALERSLASIPTSAPAAIMQMSSGFGYRSDPFTGRGAMHSGLDFKGPYGATIQAAADGKVTFVGRKGGYGRTIEITHGNGLMTRYAHLAGYNVSEGQKVTRGVKIGRMGSSGRSTGTHLHFEVRMNNRAINPRKFLEKNSDVLKVQASSVRQQPDRRQG